MFTFLGLRFGKPKSINQLQRIDLTPIEFRKIQRILVIDDEDFVWKDELIKIGFNVRHVPDVQQGFDFKTYTIILCDIDGVAKDYGTDKSGLDIMKSIRSNFPLKPVVIYSGKMDLSAAKHFSDYAIDKDEDFDEWEKLLDRISIEICDPVIQWQKARKRLLELNVTPDLIVEIENSIVVKYQKDSRSKLFNQYSKEINKSPKYNDAVKSVILSVLANIISAAIGMN